MLTRYLEQSIGTLLRQQELMRNEMAKVLESPLAPVADMARQNMELWANMQASMLSTFAPGANSSASGATRGSGGQPESTAGPSRGAEPPRRKAGRPKRRG
ncbi:MAG TPA: hypothetical protein VGI23_08990 [Steroidobacteraceae bacterium]|jgi:polyhydroxyalkanoate synthesis regulator protein